MYEEAKTINRKMHGARLISTGVEKAYKGEIRMKNFNKGFILAMLVVAFGMSACASMERNVAAEQEAQYHKPVGLDKF